MPNGTRFTVKITSVNPVHIRFLLYANGAVTMHTSYPACMRVGEFSQFILRLDPDFLSFQVPELQKEAEKVLGLRLRPAPDAPFGGAYLWSIGDA